MFYNHQICFIILFNHFLYHDISKVILMNIILIMFIVHLFFNYIFYINVIIFILTF